MKELVNQIMDYESGVMEPDEVVSFFQDLVDTGTVMKLQGHYARMARVLIDAELISQPTDTVLHVTR